MKNWVNFMGERIKKGTPQNLIPEESFMQGPFFLTLKVPSINMQPERMKRWILGGREQDYQKALLEIGKLPVGLTFEQLNEEAKRIFALHNLSQVDS